jgi:glycosyltransferase involved in cell wall biosynthesis
MIGDKKIAVVLPAYNAEKTLKTTYDEIPKDLVDEIILVDDNSSDKTSQVAQKLGITTIVHPKNLGYGGNQKTCYRTALEKGVDIIIMLHPDYQYTPKLIPAMAHLIACGEFEIVIGSRILGGRALDGGMPLYKYISNRFLTFAQNLLVGAKLSEYHTGYRAFSRRALESINWKENSNDFIFDNQMLAQLIYRKWVIGEVSCPTKYFDDASSINFSRSLKYGLGCLYVSILFRLNKMGVLNLNLFSKKY